MASLHLVFLLHKVSVYYDKIFFRVLWGILSHSSSPIGMPITTVQCKIIVTNSLLFFQISLSLKYFHSIYFYYYCYYNNNYNYYYYFSFQLFKVGLDIDHKNTEKLGIKFTVDFENYLFEIDNEIVQKCREEAQKALQFEPIDMASQYQLYKTCKVYIMKHSNLRT